MRRASQHRSAVLVTLVALILLGVSSSAVAANGTHVSGWINSNTTWTLAGSPYVIDNDLVVASGVTLTIEPGAIVKFNGVFTDFIVYGSLIARGTAANRITVTSIQDDSVGGDSGADGPTVGAPGQWYDIHTASNSAVIELDYADVRYGAWGSANNSYGAISTWHPSATVTIEHSTFSDNQRSGIKVSSKASVTVTDSTFARNAIGISVHDATVTVRSSTFSANSSNGLWFNLAATSNLPPASSLTDGTITGSGANGVYIGASSSYPLASMPWGTRNDIYGNNAGGRQLTTSGSFQNAEVNWRGNYWGEDVYYYYNDSRCWNTSPYAKGRLAYRSSTSSPPAGPLGTQYYLVPNTAIRCAYDTFNVPWNEYSPFSLHGAVGVPVGQTLGSSAGSTHARETSNYVSDPVDSATGSFTHEATDLSLPGVGVAFAFTRFYNSLDLTSGPLGQGWTDNHSATLTIEANGDVRFRGEDGQQLDYVRQPDGSFTAPTGALSALASVTGGYELSRHDQTTYRFDTAGRLASVKDRNDQGLTYAYDASGRPSTITDASGRQATLSYNADGKLTQVALPDGRTVSYVYTDGRLTSVTDAAGKVWAYTYESRGFLEKEIDPLNHTAFRNVYSADGRVVEQYDALNNKTTFSWNETTQTTVVTDPRNNTWQDVYANNVLQKRIDGTGEETQFGRDGSLNETSVTGPDGSATTMTYDARGNLLTATAPPSLGSVQKTFTYDADNNVTSVTDGRGKVTTHTHDANSNLLSTVQDGITVASYTYNAAGQVLTFTDGRNNTTTHTYDSVGNVASVTQPDPDGPGPLGQPTTTYTYDTLGNVLTRVDPKGNVAGCGCAAQYTTIFTYNARGQLLTETDPLGNVTTNDYDDAGRLTSTTDANGHTTTYTYDNANRLLTETGPDPDGTGPLTAPVTSYTYDSAGNKLTETDPRGNTTSYVYDSANRLASVTGPDPDGGGPLTAPVTTYSYDDNGNMASMVEPRGNLPGASPNDYKTTYTYDAAGRLRTTTDPLANVTNNNYDAVGNLQSVTDANGHTTSYTYDAAGRILTVTAPDPDGNGPLVAPVTTYTYDSVGNRLTRTDPNNNVTTWAYDALDRPISVTLPDPDGTGPQTPSVTTTAYDLNGNLLTVTDPNGNGTGTVGDGTTTYGYDRANRLTSIDYSDSTPDVTFTLDNAGNRLTMADGSGTETRTYDNLDRLLSVARGSNTFSYVYDPAGNITRRTHPDGTAVDYTYDPLTRLASVASDGRVTSYAYDAASNLTTTTLPSENGYVETGSYDRAGRLTGVKSQKGSDVLSDISYTLDANGNPLTETRTGTSPISKTFTYDNLDRLAGVCFQASSCPGTSDPFIRWTYDGVGNRLSEERPTGTTAYTYDNMDRLLTAGSTSYTYDRNGNQLSAGSSAFTYDLANRLKTIAQGSTTTTYSYDGDGVRLQASTGSQANEKANFLWDVNHPLPQLALERNGSDTLLRRYINGHRPVSMWTSSMSGSYYHYDPLGSVRDVTSSTGATELTYDYEPYGAVRTQAGTSPTNLLKFAGEYHDPTGLYHLRARQYDTGIGRFLQVDPLKPVDDKPAISTYAYADAKPTAFVDPTGNRAEPSSAARDAVRSASSPSLASVDRTLSSRRTSPPPPSIVSLIGGYFQSCRSASVHEKGVKISVQVAPHGYLSWGVYMDNFLLDFGPWRADIFVDSRRKDAKTQMYPPHGSLNPQHATRGSLFLLTFVHSVPRRWWAGYLTCRIP